MRPAFAACCVALALIAVGSHAWAQAAPAGHAAAAPDAAPLMPRYLLMDVQGRAVTQEDFRGRLQLVTFGYISCPDVCPTTLLEIKQVLEGLGEEAARLQAIFITVDPERDTPAVLREYTAAFDRRILGLTGSAELLRRAAESFRVRYEKVWEPGAAADNYAMNHTAGMVLLDDRGRFLARFAYGMSVHDLTERIRQAMAGGGR